MVTRNGKFLSQSLSFLSRTFSTNLPDEVKSLQELCRKFSKEELKPVADVLDKEAKFPTTEIRKLGELGLMGITASSEYGGSNLSALALSIVVEELARGCGSIGAIVSIHNCLYADLLSRLGNHEQKLRYLKPLVDGTKIGAFALSESGLISYNDIKIGLH